METTKNLTVGELKKLYHSKKANCCKCGGTLENLSSEPLGTIFVLDKKGNYYCMNCDKDFEEDDERIFDEDLYEGVDESEEA